MAVHNSDLERWRATPSQAVLLAVADHAKVDSTFIPVTRESTSRWHASVAGQDYELLLAGPKFFDTRAGTGGGGAIDLVMHLFQVQFKQAVRILTEARL